MGKEYTPAEVQLMQATDIAGTAAKKIAQQMVLYYKELRAGGIPRRYAFVLTRDFFQMISAGPK